MASIQCDVVASIRILTPSSFHHLLSRVLATFTQKDKSIKNVRLQNPGDLVCFPSSVACQVSRLKTSKHKSFPAVAKLEYGFTENAEKADEETAGEVKQKAGEYLFEHGQEGLCVLEKPTAGTRYIAWMGSLGVTGDIYVLPNIPPFSSLPTMIYLEDSQKVSEKYNFLTLYEESIANKGSKRDHIRMQVEMSR